MLNNKLLDKFPPLRNYLMLRCKKEGTKNYGTIVTKNMNRDVSVGGKFMCCMGRRMTTRLVKVKNPVNKRVINAMRTRLFEGLEIVTTQFNDIRFYLIF